MESEREFDFTQKDFKFIRDLVAEQTGIALSEAKTHMVYSRLSRRLRSLNIPTFAQYCNYLNNDNGDELVNFVNALTTNLTAFFRENHHFEYLSDTILPVLTRNNPSRRIRIWSAGCSTGEEPYSLAITLFENIPKIETWDVKILATDLDTNVLTKAASGIYDEERVAGIDGKILNKYFRAGNGSNEGRVRVLDHVKSIITFKQLNLMGPWPMKGPFDFIFCRNVVIYFDKPTQKILFERYADILASKGFLFIGHSESLFKVTDRYDLLGNTIYQKKV